LVHVRRRDQVTADELDVAELLLQLSEILLELREFLDRMGQVHVARSARIDLVDSCGGHQITPEWPATT
jgi:hypothetical protein